MVVVVVVVVDSCGGGQLWAVVGSCGQLWAVSMRMHRIWVPGHLGVNSQRPRHTRAPDDQQLLAVEGSKKISFSAHHVHELPHPSSAALSGLGHLSLHNDGRVKHQELLS